MLEIYCLCNRWARKSGSKQGTQCYPRRTKIFRAKFFWSRDCSRGLRLLQIYLKISSVFEINCVHVKYYYSEYNYNTANFKCCFEERHSCVREKDNLFSHVCGQSPQKCLAMRRITKFILLFSRSFASLFHFLFSLQFSDSVISLSLFLCTKYCRVCLCAFNLDDLCPKLFLFVTPLLLLAAIKAGNSNGVTNTRCCR